MSEALAGRLRLLCITPGDRPAAAVAALVQQVLGAGVTAVLLREPALAPGERLDLGHSLASFCRAAGALLLVSNDPALARACAADGVQLGHAGPNVAAVRRGFPGMLVGRSAHWPLGAEDRAADYLTLSPVASTPRSLPRPLLTPAQIRQAADDPGLGPVVALGGLEASTVARLPDGLAGVAVIRALAQADDPAAAARALRRAVEARGQRLGGAAR